MWRVISVLAVVAALAGGCSKRVQSGTTPAGDRPGENLPQDQVATVMEMAGRAEIIALAVIEKKQDQTALDGGIFYDVRIEKLLRGKWDKGTLRFHSAAWVGYAVYDTDERVLLFLQRFNDEFVQLRPVIYLVDKNRPRGLTLQPAEEYIKIVANMAAGQGYPWGDALPGSDISVEQAIQKAVSSEFAYAAVCRATSGFGDDAFRADGIRLKNGKLSAMQTYEIPEVIWGNMKPRLILIVYGLTCTSGLRERPVGKGETVLWICSGREGIKVLADTPANRQAIQAAGAAIATQPTTLMVPVFETP